MRRRLPRYKGKLIAIEGIDQSGKRTQTQLLAKKLRAMGRPTSTWSFPDYTTPLGRQLKNYLRGRRLDFHAVHLLYAANKWERARQLTAELERGRAVVVNRYTPSNLAYGVAHGLPLSWLLSLEKGLPTPDIVLVLDITPKTSFKRKESRRDIHEENLQYLTKVRRAYLKLAKMYKWSILDANRERVTVHANIWRVTAELL